MALVFAELRACALWGARHSLGRRSGDAGGCRRVHRLAVARARATVGVREAGTTPSGFLLGAAALTAHGRAPAGVGGGGVAPASSGAAAGDMHGDLEGDHADLGAAITELIASLASSAIFHSHFSLGPPNYQKQSFSTAFFMICFLNCVPISSI